jgi:hypothetical protein
MEVLETFDRLDHDHRQQIAVGVERPDVRTPLVFGDADSPGVARRCRRVAANANGFPTRRAAQRWIPHRPYGGQRLILCVHAVEDHAHQSDVAQCSRLNAQ